ncbi:MAG: hypothetical protein U0L20_07830, partial [Ruminococcus sp.]|nr:hypothetical protein [Ruminococcus sp.]
GFIILHFLAVKKHNRLLKMLIVDCNPVGFLNAYYPLLSRSRSKVSDLLLLNLSKGYIFAGDFVSAENALKSINLQRNKAYPFLCGYYSDMISICVNTGRLKEAQAHLNAYKQFVDGMMIKPERKNIALFTYNFYTCLINIENGYYEGAEEFILSSLTDDLPLPTKLSYKKALGKLYMNTGRTDEAIQMFDFVVSNGNTMYLVKEAQEYLSKLKSNKL